MLLTVLFERSPQIQQVEAVHLALRRDLWTTTSSRVHNVVTGKWCITRLLEQAHTSKPLTDWFTLQDLGLALHEVFSQRTVRKELNAKSVAGWKDPQPRVPTGGEMVKCLLHQLCGDNSGACRSHRTG